MNDDQSSSSGRCEAEADASVATIITSGTQGVLSTPVPTMETSSDCPSHCQPPIGDNGNSNYNDLSDETLLGFPIEENVRWQDHPHPDGQSSSSDEENLLAFIDMMNLEDIRRNNPFTDESENPCESTLRPDITVMIDIDDENGESQTTRFQAHEDIAQVLENFNSILDSIDLNYSPSVDHDSGGLEFGGDANDEEEFLIVVDDNNPNESTINSGVILESEPDNETEQMPSSSGLDSDNNDPEEGYESDRPMVRASMRKLKPVQMLPMPQVPNNPPIVESPCHQTLPGFATTLNSPITNRILVASLVEALSSPNYGDGASSSGSTPEHPSRTTGSRSQSHSRSQSRSNNNAFISNGTSRNDLTMNIDGAVHVLPMENPYNDGQNRLTSVHGQGSGISGGDGNSSASGSGETAGMNSRKNSISVGCGTSLETPNRTNVSGQILRVPAEGLHIESSRNGRTDSDGIVVETIGIGQAVMMQSGARTTETTATTSDPSRTTTNPETTSPSSRRNAATRNPQSSPSGVSPGRWPHRLSSVLALIGCTLGLNNICRFGLLSVEYGANFTIQFIFLSLVFGIPLLTFHMSSGQYLASGIIDMWKISPIFQGIGIGLVISQAMIGIYTAVGVSWMFIYFRDSFITRYDLYRWAKCFRDYRDCDQYLYNSTQLAETVPDYFNGVVLQRGSPDYPSSSLPSSSLKFTVAFNLAVVWMLIFVSLSKGQASFSKAIHGFVLVPVAAILVLASKMVGLVPSDETSSLFGQTSWSTFFFDSQTWVIAAREAFFTWGLLGACIMQITSHNRPSHSLKSDASIVILITTFVLLLSAFLGNACFSVLSSYGYTYVASSFESDQTYKFLIRKPPDNLIPSSMYHHTSFLMGIRIVPPMDVPMNGNTVSGYQVLRLATELFPATMAVLGSQGLSPFWTVLFYFTFILFGIAQQLAIWYCVIKGVIAIRAKTLKSWETTITFFVCASGFLLGLPLCTEFGIFVEYFLDYAIGSGWWIMVLYLLELVAVFIVRGAPYCGENIVTVLMTGRGKLATLLSPLISFLWNVILPVAMLVLSITSFKNGNIRELYDWNPLHGYAFWPSWTRELGTLIQLLPILTVPFVAIVQSCRYLTNGPPDLFDRMQQLYRPHSRGLLGRTLSEQLGRNGSGDSSSRNNSQNRTPEDPPPKYTPPPSYSTATSARIAKFLRASLRRSLRRLPGVSHANENQPPPPNYASVILEINSQSQQNACCSQNLVSSPIPILISPPVPDSYEIARDTSSDEMNRPVFRINLAQSHTLGRHLEPTTTERDKTRGSLRRIASDISPREVARILRASFRQDGKTNSSDKSNENLSNSRNPRDRAVQGNENGPDNSSDSDHMRLTSSGLPNNHNFDFHRKRQSNDSQLALISSRNNSVGSNDLPHYSDLMDLGIINPTSFQSNLFPELGGVSRNQVGNSNTGGPGHIRSHSLNVPTSFDSLA